MVTAATLRQAGQDQRSFRRRTIARNKKPTGLRPAAKSWELRKISGVRPSRCAPMPEQRARGLNGTCPHFCRHRPRREETRLLLRGLRRRCFLGGWRRLLHRCRRLRRGSLGRSLGRSCLLCSGLGRGLGSRLPGRSGFLCRSGLLGRCSLLCGCGAGLGGRCLLRRRFRGGLGCRLFGRCRLCLRRCRLRFGSGCCFLDRGRGFRRRRFYRCFLCRCLGCRRF